MSRVVIYGDYPPASGPAAEATLAAVRSRLAGGAGVEVVSPEPSAAHHHADLSTVRGAARLARLAAGADLEMALDPAVLTGRGGRGAGPQALLALAVSRARHSTVHVGPLGRATGRGRVRLVLGRAGAVTAASEADADASERAGVDRSRLSVRPTSPSTPTERPGQTSAGNGTTPRPWDLSERPEREELEAAVRRRATQDREADAADSDASTWPLHLLTPISPPPPFSRQPSAAVVTRVRRLTACVVEPIVEHVNRLHSATIESIDRHTARQDHSGSGGSPASPEGAASRVTNS